MSISAGDFLLVLVSALAGLIGAHVGARATRDATVTAIKAQHEAEWRRDRIQQRALLRATQHELRRNSDVLKDDPPRNRMLLLDGALSAALPVIAELSGESYAHAMTVAKAIDLHNALVNRISDNQYPSQTRAGFEPNFVQYRDIFLAAATPLADEIDRMVEITERKDQVHSVM